MANGRITRDTVHLRKLTPEEKELRRLDNERWSKAKAEAREKLKASSGPAPTKK